MLLPHLNVATPTKTGFHSHSLSEHQFGGSIDSEGVGPGSGRNQECARGP